MRGAGAIRLVGKDGRRICGSQKIERKCMGDWVSDGARFCACSGVRRAGLQRYWWELVTYHLRGYFLVAMPPAYLWGDVGNRAWVRPTREPLACVRRAQRAPDWPPARRFGDGYQRIGVGWLGFVGPYDGGMRS